jgi:hypothetical protein
LEGTEYESWERVLTCVFKILIFFN